MKNWAYRIAIYGFTLFVLLFDTDGQQLGASIIDAPAWVVQTASIFGNIFWLFGILMFVVGIILIIISTDKAKINDTLKENSSEKKREALLKISPLAIGTGVVFSLFAIGSGFWFYGTGWLVALVGVNVWRSTLKTRAEEIDKENGVEKPFSAEDELRKSLLDD